jgi:two-component SAPR family response regulator
LVETLVNFSLSKSGGRQRMHRINPINLLLFISIILFLLIENIVLAGLSELYLKIYASLAICNGYLFPYNLFIDNQVLSIPENINTFPSYFVKAESFQIVIVLLSALFIGFSFNRLKIYRGLKLSNKHLSDKKTESEVSNFIYVKVFGSFEIKAGNIEYHLSPKLKQLFVLLLFHTYDGNGQKGIACSKLSDLLWPYSSPEEAKNNRGVTIRNLRKALLSVEGISIVCENHLWKLKLDNHIVCDYKNYMEIKKCGPSAENLDDFINNVSSGKLLADEDYEWLDSIKYNTNVDIINTLISFVSSEGLDSNKMNVIIETILSLDPLNENGIILKIEHLINEKRSSIAKTSYDNYALEFFKAYGIQFPVRFEDIYKKCSKS